MRTLASTVASFYWQLAGSIHRDIPVNDEGKAEEFNRYVGYFLDEKEAFQGPLTEPLRQMAEATYLEAIAKNHEPRSYLRLASRRASAARRCTRSIVLGCSMREREESQALRDSVEALLLDNGSILAEHVLGQLGLELREKTRLTAQRLVRTERVLGKQSRVRDLVEATAESVLTWSRLLRSHPRQAVRSLIREVINFRTLVPTEAYVVVDAFLVGTILTAALAQITSPLAALTAAVVCHVAWFIADVATYMIHVNSDGWGDSMGSKVFQDHHTHEDEAAEWTWLRAIATTAPKVLPFMILLAVSRPHFTIAIPGMVILQGLLIAPKTHGMAHRMDSKGWFGALQKCGLLLSPEEHARHHQETDRAFAGLSGWSNRVMDGVGYPNLHATVRMWMRSGPPKWIQEKVALNAGRRVKRQAVGEVRVQL